MRWSEHVVQGHVVDSEVSRRLMTCRNEKILWVGCMTFRGRMGRRRYPWLPMWLPRVTGASMCSKREWATWTFADKLCRLFQLGRLWLAPDHGHGFRAHLGTLRDLIKLFIVLLITVWKER